MELGHFAIALRDTSQRRTFVLSEIVTYLLLVIEHSQLRTHLEQCWSARTSANS